MPKEKMTGVHWLKTLAPSA
nr:hypothetical protein [Neisseria musculi]